MYVHAFSYQHNARKSDLALLPKIPLIYVKGKGTKVEVREFNIRTGSRKMLVPDLSRYFMPHLSIGLLAITAASIPDYGRSSSNRIALPEAPMQSRTASRDGKCFLWDNFISLSLQLRRSAFQKRQPPYSPRFVTSARVNVTRHFSAIAPIHRAEQISIFSNFTEFRRVGGRHLLLFACDYTRANSSAYFVPKSKNESGWEERSKA